MAKTRDNAALAQLTDEWIAEAATAELRMAAETMLEEYSYRTNVASIQMGEPVVEGSGALTAIDVLFDKLTAVYRKANMEPKRIQRYGELQITVWQDDYNLRSNLKYAAKRARDEAAKDESGYTVTVPE
jgi:hypothetical protein